MQAGACDVSQLAEPSNDGHLVLIDREEAGEDQQNSEAAIIPMPIDFEFTTAPVFSMFVARGTGRA